MNKEELKQMYEQDSLSLRQISKKTGLPIKRVWNLCKKYEIKMRPFSTKGLKTRLGAVLSEETKRKISNSHKGKKLSEAHKIKLSEVQRLQPKGQDSHNWKGGLSMRNGYVLVHNPDHPKARCGYVKRCHLVAELKYGRQKQRDEDVHHINGNKMDDSFENIILLSHGEHSRLHRNQEVNEKAI